MSAETAGVDPMGRLLGIDYGTRRIGLALSDELGWTARPIETIPASSWTQAVGRIREIVEANRVERIVLGAPGSLKGHAGTLSEEVSRFARLLEAEVHVPVVLWDERMSSLAAARIQRELGRSDRQGRDRLAAAWILQGYLDRLAHEKDTDGREPER